jgi:hypothetical protein
MRRSAMKERRGSNTAVGREIAASADSDYKAKVRDVRKKLADIERAIKDHERAQAVQANDYGYVGDVGHAFALLVDVERFLRGQG